MTAPPRDPAEETCEKILRRVMAEHKNDTGGGSQRAIAYQIALIRAGYDAAPAPSADTINEGRKGNEADTEASGVTPGQQAPTQGESAEYLAPSPTQPAEPPATDATGECDGCGEVKTLMYCKTCFDQPLAMPADEEQLVTNQGVAPPETDDLVRWGNADTDEVGRKSGWHQRADGYWTPWHVADALVKRQAREIADLTRRLEMEKRRHAHGMSKATEHDPPEVLATLGFWPDCRCTECYAIEQLGQALQRAERAEAERDEARECVKAADAMRDMLYKPRGDRPSIEAYDAARAKVKP